MGAAEDAVVEPAARTAYRDAFRDPAVRHAMCEDYRAAFHEDLALDQADRASGRKLDCPVLVIGSRGQQRDGAPTSAVIWRRWADDVAEATTTGGHLQMEDRPQDVLDALVPFLC